MLLKDEFQLSQFTSEYEGAILSIGCIIDHLDLVGKDELHKKQSFSVYNSSQYMKLD